MQISVRVLKRTPGLNKSVVELGVAAAVGLWFLGFFSSAKSIL
jgi:hypothetical protein